LIHQNGKLNQLLKKFITKKTLHIWRDNNTKQIVTTAAISRETSSGCGIGFVYTPPQFRNNGYAKACVANLTKKILYDIGKEYAFLLTQVSNPISNAVYIKIGYKYIVDLQQWKIKLD